MEDNVEIIEKMKAIVPIMGSAIYDHLMDRFPNQNFDDFNIIFNSICYAMTLLIKNNADEEDRAAIIQRVYTLLNKNCQ